jgi:hypothetical protein
MGSVRSAQGCEYGNYVSGEWGWRAVESEGEGQTDLRNASILGAQLFGLSNLNDRASPRRSRVGIAVILHNS